MLAGATLLASTLLGAGPAQSADAPAEFGTDWHDQVTAAPPVARPAGRPAQSPSPRPGSGRSSTT